MACASYKRPLGVLDGPCLLCGRSQPEHVNGDFPDHSATVSIDRAAELKGCSRRTIYNMITQGRVEVKPLPSGGGCRVFLASLAKATMRKKRPPGR